MQAKFSEISMEFLQKVCPKPQNSANRKIELKSRKSRQEIVVNCGFYRNFAVFCSFYRNLPQLFDVWRLLVRNVSRKVAILRLLPQFTALFWGLVIFFWNFPLKCWNSGVVSQRAPKVANFAKSCTPHKKTLLSQNVTSTAKSTWKLRVFAVNCSKKAIRVYVGLGHFLRFTAIYRTLP